MSSDRNNTRSPSDRRNPLLTVSSSKNDNNDDESTARRIQSMQQEDPSTTSAAAAVVESPLHQNNDHDSEFHGVVSLEKDGLMVSTGTTGANNSSELIRTRLADRSEGAAENVDVVVVDEGNSDFWHTVAGVAGNVLEWYDFAVFGYFSDVLGTVFFPPGQDGDSATMESFLVFGGAFLMRPVGGLLLGYIGDVYGRKKALVISIFLMAFPTFAMGCLPSYATIGDWAIVLLVLIRLLQGLSVGGQLMSSLVFTLENHDPLQWGLYGSFVMAAANFGTLLGGIAGCAIRALCSEEQLISWGWRIPFVSGIFVSFSGFYLKSHGGDHDGHHYHQPGGGHNNSSNSNDENENQNQPAAVQISGGEMDDTADEIVSAPTKNPLFQALSRENLRSLMASSMVPMLWSAGFYLSFVWMAIFMTDLIDKPVPGAFAVNSAALLVSVCLLFPFAGVLSDRFGRRRIMTIGGVGMGVLSPILVVLIGKGNPVLAFFAQSTMGISLSLWGAPMCAWLVEAFEPDARLTSVSIGYNLAQAIAGGITPFLATVLVDQVGPGSPGWILTALSVISLTGLLCVAPNVAASGSSGPKNKDFQRISTDAAIPSASKGAEVELPELHQRVVVDGDDDNELI